MRMRFWAVSAAPFEQIAEKPAGRSRRLRRWCRPRVKPVDLLLLAAVRSVRTNSQALRSRFQQQYPQLLGFLLKRSRADVEAPQACLCGEETLRSNVVP